MLTDVPTLKTLAFSYIIKNIDRLFYKQLHRITKYLQDNKCNDRTDYYIDNSELRKETSNLSQTNPGDAIVVLRDFLTSRDLPKILWLQQYDKRDGQAIVGLKIKGLSVKVKHKILIKAKYLAAKLMLRKLYSKYLDDRIIKKYINYEQRYSRDAVYESDSLLAKEHFVPQTINSVDELIGYAFTEEERWEILRNIPEYKMRRSYYFLILHPNSKHLDFSFCPAAFSPLFLELILKKIPEVETVNLDGCFNSAPIASECLEAVVRRCNKLQNLTVNNCIKLNSEVVFEWLRRRKISLKKLAVSNVGKRNIDYGSLHYEKYFTRQLGGRLIVLDISGLQLCENELVYILQHCKRLVNLNIAETRYDCRCYCRNHEQGNIKYDSTVITRLRELNVSNTTCQEKVLKLLIDNNKDLVKLFKGSKQLRSVDSEINLKQLEYLRVLDVSFQGCAAYEDFSLYKHDLPISLLYLDASGFCDLDLSHLSVECPYLRDLHINACKINIHMSCRTEEDAKGDLVIVPHCLQNFKCLRRLELRHSDVYLEQLLDSRWPLPIEEFTIAGDCLTDPALRLIVNKRIGKHHLFNRLKRLHISNCNNITDFALEDCDFLSMPSLSDLTIERCSKIKPCTLGDVQNKLLYSAITFSCFIEDERPRELQPPPNVVFMMG